MESTKFTVVVPTRERSDVLYSTLRTILAQEYENLDVLVSDNFSSDDTQEVVSSFNDSRLRYVNPGRRLSMSHHWEFALEQVDSEGWLTVLGDDDGLLPSALLEVAELISECDVEAIRSATCSYQWPVANTDIKGELQVPLRDGVEVRESARWLTNVFYGRAQYLQLPMLYNGGFVSMKLVDRLRASSGCIYRSCIPDVYSAVAFSKLTRQYLYSYRPFAVNGASRHSTGASQFQTVRSSDAKDVVGDKDMPAKKFLSEGNIPFHPDIPMGPDGGYPKSISAMVFESHLQSLDLGGNVPDIPPSAQLEIALKRSGKNREAVEQWGERFASLHALDYAAIAARAGRLRLLEYARDIGSDLDTLCFSYRSSPSEFTLADVFEASNAAAEVLKARPGLYSRVQRNLAFRLNLS